MKKNIFYIPFLVILMLIVFPLAIYGLYANKFKKGETITNSYLEITDDISYTCLINGCSFYNSDSEIINNEYVLIEDGNIKLFDINLQSTIQEFNSILNIYQDKNIIIASDSSDKYGVYDYNNKEYIISNDYNEIYFLDGYDDYVVYDGSYYIVNNNNEVLSGKVNSKIIKYNSYYIITEDNHIYDYNGNVLSDNSYNNIELYNNVVLGYIDSTLVIYKDSILERDYQDYPNAKYEVNDYELIIYDETGNLIEEYLFN